MSDEDDELVKIMENVTIPNNENTISYTPDLVDEGNTTPYLADAANSVNSSEESRKRKMLSLPPASSINVRSDSLAVPLTHSAEGLGQDIQARNVS